MKGDEKSFNMCPKTGKVIGPKAGKIYAKLKEEAKKKPSPL